MSRSRLTSHVTNLQKSARSGIAVRLRPQLRSLQKISTMTLEDPMLNSLRLGATGMVTLAHCSADGPESQW